MKKATCGVKQLDMTRTEFDRLLDESFALGWTRCEKEREENIFSSLKKARPDIPPEITYAILLRGEEMLMLILH